MQHSAELERNSFAPVTLLICWNITTPHFVCSPFMSGSRLRRQEEGWGAPLVWGWGASFGAKPRHRHHRHIGTGCLGPRAPSVLVVRVLSGAVPSSKTHTEPLSSFVRRSNLMFQLYACHWMLTPNTGPRVPFENYPLYIGRGRGGGVYDADLAPLLIFLQQGTLTHSKLTQYRPLVRIFSFSFKSKIKKCQKSSSNNWIENICWAVKHLKEFKTSATCLVNGNPLSLHKAAIALVITKLFQPTNQGQKDIDFCLGGCYPCLVHHRC